MWRLIRYDLPMHFILRLTNWLPDNVIFIRLRGWLTRPFFKKCGQNLGIGRNVTFYNPSQIEIGNWVYIAYGCWFQGSDGINIGDEVLFGPYVTVTTSNHTRINGSWRFGIPSGKKINICQGSWIGANCSILSGANIGTGSVIASNTSVFEEVSKNSLFAAPKGKEKKTYS
jgi:acetyltransferase-like isoleucine patch superfamily enzyme